MRYRYEKPTIYSKIYGSTYKCDHPMYSECTLFKINNRGLAAVNSVIAMKQNLPVGME